MEGDSLAVEDAIPGPAEFCQLRVDSGLSAMDEAVAAVALPRSLFAVTVRAGDRLIGMGRVVGDGLHVQVTDIAVHPEFQKRGISSTIMRRIMRFITEDVSETAVVSLFADVDWLYGKYGFAEPQVSVGMFFKRSDPSPG